MTARFAVRIKRKKVLEHEGTELAIGTRADCALALRDAVAAPRHAVVVHERGRGFFVRDAGSDTGTYRNGQALGPEPSGPLAAGDELVVGTTRLLVDEVAADALTLQLQLGDVGFTAPGAGQFASDPDRWVRRETEMARSPAVAAATRAALQVLVLGLPLLLLLAPLREAINDPGPLMAGHAALFAADPPAAFAREAQIARELGCNACHDRFGGTPDSACQRCHEEIATRHHPFGVERPDPDRARFGSGFAAGHTCAGCHRDHFAGSDFVPDHETTPDTCARCHAGTEVERGGYRPERPSETPAMASRRHGSFRFAHADHAAVDCAQCHHRELASAELSPRLASDFAPVAYETCAGCHVQGQQDPTVPAEWRPKAEHTWTVRWHGSEEAGETCARCHAPGDGAGGLGPALRELPRPDLTPQQYAGMRARYSLLPRDHQEFFADGGRRCGECHADLDRKDSGRRDGTFWHQLHLPTTLPEDGAGERQLSDTCLSCHGDLRQAAALTDATRASYRCADEQTCGRCHRDAQGAARIPDPVPATAFATAVRPDFPHDAHLDFRAAGPLAQGCFACHEFAASDAERPFAVPVTKAEAQRCLPCHQRHDQVGGGACGACHPSPDGAWNVYLGAGIDERTPPARPWPDRSPFAHYSPGHRDATEAGDCARCHRDGAALTELADLASLRAPLETDAGCRDCHLGERRRFHWR